MKKRFELDVGMDVTPDSIPGRSMLIVEYPKRCYVWRGLVGTITAMDPDRGVAWVEFFDKRFPKQMKIGYIPYFCSQCGSTDLATPLTNGEFAAFCLACGYAHPCKHAAGLIPLSELVPWTYYLQQLEIEKLEEEVKRSIKKIAGLQREIRTKKEEMLGIRIEIQARLEEIVNKY
jgi:hypothetical protein